MLATHGLWLRPTTSEFPSIPFAQNLCGLPAVVDACLLGGLCLALLGMLAPIRRLDSLGWVRVQCAVICVCGCGLVALNQHRLQPWFYQLLLFAVVFTLANGWRQLQLLRYLVISVYCYSALGKWDYEFLHTVGQQFLAAVTGPLGMDIGHWSASSRLLAVAMLPLAELLLALALCIGTLKDSPGWRAWAGGIACLFHALLMLIFGLGLRHSWGVVLWNLQFAVQAWLLFVAPRVRQPQTARMPFQPGWVSLVVGLAMALPLLERFGFWDHWPSWALYAPHSSRIELYVAQAAIHKLPADLQPLVERDESLLWLRVPLGQWSLAALGTPIYPQARFELGVARDIARRVDSEFTVRAVVLGTAQRFSGRRRSREFLGKSGIEQAANLFWLNTQPRHSMAPRELDNASGPAD